MRVSTIHNGEGETSIWMAVDVEGVEKLTSFCKRV